MVEIKNAISFDEYMTIVNTVSQNCFPNDTYSPAYYEIMFRYALLQMFAPDYNIPKISETNYNDVWDKVTNGEANEILCAIRQNRMYHYLEEAVENAIDYRIKKSNSLETALTNLIKTFITQMNNMPEIPQETLEKFADVVANSNNQDLAKNMFDVMVDEGVLAKPNRATRRNNIKHNKKSESK